jgi:tRNA-specific adenosine deaminase 3
VDTSHLPHQLRDSVQREANTPTIHLLVPPPLPVNHEELIAALRPYTDSHRLPVVRATQIPLDPPSSSEQAALWSDKYWPCTFNPASQTLQKAPPLHVLRTALAELDDAAQLESYFRLADLAGAQCLDREVGRKIGAVVVDPVKREVIAVAGDARSYGSEKTLQLNEGRPEHHALMRAIAMVARKDVEQREDYDDPSSEAKSETAADLQGKALTPTERLYVTSSLPRSMCLAGDLDLPPAQSSARPDAYLCNNLDVYLTHEPCVACAMAMIHSRFRACVFEKRMPGTGALVAEKDDGGMGYGLFWRKELNWRVLTFQYFREVGERGQSPEQGRGDERERQMFHA